MNQTQANLLKAIAGESMARNKYTYFSDIAEKEGLIWVSRVFLETADNERAHAEEELKRITSKVEMTNTYGIDPLGTTLENLIHAAEGEEYEFGTMYPDFKKVAEEEGEDKIATLFQEISEVEVKHAERYRILIDLVEKGTMFKSEQPIDWKCLNCGYVHNGTEAPDNCPACLKEQGWYMPIGVVR